MTALPFTKMQAVGNDFVVVEEAVWGQRDDWAQTAIALCDRHKGVGGDGLLVVCPSAVADVRMRMLNPDGTEDMCGNGLRCVVLWAWERGAFGNDPRRPMGSVETLSGVLSVGLILGGDEAVGVIEEIWTELGKPLFRPADLPMLIPERDAVTDFSLPVEGEDIIVSTVNTGTTHTVIWVNELPGDERFFAVSPQIENHPLFPERTSVLWAKSCDEGNCFDIRIWERGAGETLGCGTGACAVTVLAAVAGKTAPHRMPSQPRRVQQSFNRPVKSHTVRVRSRGGDLVATYTTDDREPKYNSPEPILLSGMAHTVYSGVFAPTP